MPLTSVLGDSTRRPDITFYRSGKVDVTAGVVRKLGMMPGDSLDIIADQYECCITVRHHATAGRFEALCRKVSSNSGNLRVWSRRLTDFMCKRFGADKVALAAGAVIIHDGDRALTLINRNLL